MYPLVLRLSKLMAIVGGIMLCALIILVCTSILGRQLNGLLHSDFLMGIAPTLSRSLIDFGIGPVNGDFEMVEAGMAFVVFSFLPYTQLTGGHAAVDVFTQGMSARVNRVLVLIGEVLFAAVLIIIALQLYGGMMSKIRSGQVTLLLEFPVWWGYAISLVGAVIAALCAVYVAAARTKEVLTGEEVLPDAGGAEH